MSTRTAPTDPDADPDADPSVDDGALSRRLVGWVLTVTGLIGGLAAFVLMVEKVALLRDPDYTPTCSINPILSCGSVMTTSQAEAFGFPNPLIGVAAFPVVVTTGVAVLAGLRLPRWWWLGLQAGAVFGVGFVHWLFFQSVYRIGALCPYCMVVWVAMIVLFCYTTLYTLDRGHLRVPARWRGAVDAAARVHTAIPVAWLLILTALIGEAFWSYWRTLL
ncbi:vitamin K epoxide reductase family protein [Virgisporangium ochraceum]|uniref:Membrane protein n=1 Tax=Virgisporangium ochraceum TaxID=65505 RepID=A0A8J4A5D2_9ACTN|nr:vitamin K epoxide reductase family protein [Virgisporangium ochraceum]GIJ74130.1 membrane protein [Virgisporangium ochraceum]